MPKKPKNNHPLRHIRESAGLTQAQLAQMIGISKDYLQSIELERAPMTSQIALKIARQTGCVLVPGGANGEQATYQISKCAGRTLAPYTKEDFDAHQKEMGAVRRFVSEDITDLALNCIDLIFRMAARRGVGTIGSVAQDFETFITNVYREYGLEPFFIAEVRENWLPFNEELPITQDALNFALIPMSVAAKYPRPETDAVTTSKASSVREK